MYLVTQLVGEDSGFYVGEILGLTAALFLTMLGTLALTGVLKGLRVKRAWESFFISGKSQAKELLFLLLLFVLLLREWSDDFHVREVRTVFSRCLDIEERLRALKMFAG